MRTVILHISWLILLVILQCTRHGALQPSDPEHGSSNTGVTLEQAAGMEASGPEFTIDPPGTAFPDTILAKPEAEGTSPDEEPYYDPAWKPGNRTLKSPSNIPISAMEEYAQETAHQRPNRFSHEAFFRYGVTSGEFVVALNWDNDMIDYTDYYYTSGLSLEICHPSIAFSPLSAMLPRLRASTNYYSLILMHHMYTPIYLDMEAIQENDRPFAAYLALGHRNISLSQQKMRRIESEFLLGVIGPAAGGSFAQNFIHEDPSLGWQNQVHNDFVINYSLRYEQGVFSSRSISLAVYGGGQAGTLYDNLKAGLFIQAGRTMDRYGNPLLTTGPEKPFKKRIRYYFAFDVENKLMIYDATLQGGMINQSSPHVLSESQVNRYVLTGKFSTGIGFGRYAVEAEQFFLTPEYQGGRRHLWLRIRNIFYLN